MLSTARQLSEIADVPELDQAIDSRSLERGRRYARGNRVLKLAWQDPETLSGSVVGKGALYEVVAHFAPEKNGSLAFEDGECSCPVSYDCKHVAALVIAGYALREHDRDAPPGPDGRGSLELAPQPAAPAWDAPLRALVDAPSQRAAGNPLAIELTLHARGPAESRTWRLMARLMRQGARGRWINGSLTWSDLDTWRFREAQLRPDHAALARELWAMYLAHKERGYYHYSADKALDLGECDSARLWALLRDATRVGVPLIHGHVKLGEVRVEPGELVIDVTTEGPDERPTVRAALWVHGRPAHHLDPLLFLGVGGHGVVCAERPPEALAAGGAAANGGAPNSAGPNSAGPHSAGPHGAGLHGAGPEAGRLWLVHLERPAPEPLQRMLLGGQVLEVPAGELSRFAEQLCPELRHLATVVSSDGSFTVPEISAPALVLRARHGADHTLDVGWEWAYQVGGATRREPLQLNGGGPGVRDLEAERAILAGLDLRSSGLERFGLLDLGGQPQAQPTPLVGIDSARLATEVLPALRELPDVAVEELGDGPDYRDVGGSLEIGLSTAEIAEERDWFDLGVTITVDGRELPFAEVFTALANGDSHMLLTDGAHFSLLTPELQELRRLIEEARTLSDSPGGALRISRYQAGLWSELAALGVVTEQARAWRDQASALLGLATLDDHQPPAAITARLRPYQREGFHWLASLWGLELGGILADDMGLGKTVQVLSLICHTRERDADGGPFLVVVPSSVVSGWVSEARRFAPSLTVEPVTDTLARSGRSIEQIAEADVVVTTYTLFRLDFDAYRSQSWAGLVLDEAQYVKNHQAKTYRCVRELAAPFKLAMTGTPMENNLMELWSLLSIGAPGLFPDPQRFAEQYAKPIERRGDGERLERLRRRIKPLLMRRTKELVAPDLPAKQEQTLEVDLPARHRKLYDTHLQRERQKILGLLGDLNRHRFTILRSITLLRQLSLHPGLVDPAHDSVPCAKLSALVEQLRDVGGGGHRALVFSQFTGFLAKVRERLDHEGIGYCYLDGSTRRRERVLARFKDGADPVFLISLKAGGFGLNLTEADYCFLLDPWWNPATEAQAIDRTHRIGQTRPVNVYRMIARGTIEEKVAALARRKAALFSGVMDDGDLFAGSLTAEDIRGLVG
ncbi:MAG: SNF2 family helicase [Solirubrobacterales bacterium]|nr:SNF2 family helicase [Solirubrobacterales bacterium]